MKELILNKRFEFVKTADSVTVTVDGQKFGDRLSDIYHICFAFYLDWSPVCDKLINNSDSQSHLLKLEEAIAFICNIYGTHTNIANKLLMDCLMAILDRVFIDSRWIEQKDWQRAIERAWGLEFALAACGGGTITVENDELYFRHK